MYFTKRISAVLLTAALMFGLTACSGTNNSSTADSSSATVDEANVNEEIVEESPNVNGMRYNLTLTQFTDRYNAEKSRLKEKDVLTLNSWVKDDNTELDNNSVHVQYWHHDDQNVSFTATVEARSEKIMNIGCGTAVNNYQGKTEGAVNSDPVLKKAALMAQVACGFPSDSRETLADIFDRTVTEPDNSLWYKGFVFNFSTMKDKKDETKDIMLFRVFPVTNELKQEWSLKEYTNTQE